MIQSGDRVVILRRPTTQEDPDGAWIDEFEEIVGEHGTIVEDSFPYAADSTYARVAVDDYDDFFLPIPILTKVETQ